MESFHLLSARRRIRDCTRADVDDMFPFRVGRIARKRKTRVRTTPRSVQAKTKACSAEEQFRGDQQPARISGDTRSGDAMRAPPRGLT